MNSESKTPPPRILETILTMDPYPDLLPETEEERAQARERLEKKPFKKK